MDPARSLWRALGRLSGLALLGWALLVEVPLSAGVGTAFGAVAAVAVVAAVGLLSVPVLRGGEQPAEPRAVLRSCSPAAPARQCDPAAAGRPRPRAPGQRAGARAA